MLPAAALLAAKPTRAAIAGDPLVVGHELPGAVREAEQIARLLATEPSAAGEAGVTIGLRTCSIAHLATHAELDRRRPAFARLQLAADAENDGWLHAYEIARLGLARRPLVVLSGCVTAGHADRAHGLLGLLSAFLGAGARCVVATHWQVEDRASLELMQRFHRAEADPVTALTEAQRAVLARGRGDVSGWSHPLYWAAYALYGRP